MIQRLRKLQKSKWIRDFVSESHIDLSNFVYPIFVGEHSIASSKNSFEVFKVSELSKILDKVQNAGVSVVALFPVCPKNLKDHFASYAYNSNNELCKAIKFIKSSYPSIGVMSDIALDPYTIHGHDGILKNDYVDNDETLKYCAKQALTVMEAGSDIIAPSHMMDNKVASLRCLSNDIIIGSYSAKYCSSFYAPFRNTLNNLHPLDKSTYQSDPRNSNQAIISIENDIKQGADFIIIKPSMLYLDIMYRAKVEFNVPIVSATQTTRSGYANSDIELTDTSESFGLPATADLMFAIISNEELEKLGQLMVKQLKNRYNDPSVNKRFMIGVDRGKMKLYDVEDSQQVGITDSGQEELTTPVFDNTRTGVTMFGVRKRQELNF